MKSEIVLPILPTSVIGSYPRPRWLRRIIRSYNAGRIDEKVLEEAFNDAVVAVVRDQEAAGVDIPSDGEMRRDEMVEYFAKRIKGFKFYGPVRVWGNNFFNKPAVVSKLSYEEAITVKEYEFLRRVSSREIVKMTITGPYTIADWSYNEYYSSKEELAHELAKIINREILELERAGARFVQIDEPALTTHPEEMEWAVEVVNEATRGVSIKLGLHVCYSNYELLSRYFDRLNVSQFALEFANRGFRDLEILRRLGDKEIGFGVVDVHSRRVESVDEVVKALRKVMDIVSPDKIYVNPDCGLKLLPREIAKAKLEVMVEGVRILRRELEKRGLTSIVLR
ncbi:MAG: methionine synthase [Sulfolobales archaeon]|jgi:5-methyltetrahydropteroyltriglutamate--homocysteine methyltransferase